MHGHEVDEPHGQMFHGHVLHGHLLHGHGPGPLGRSMHGHGHGRGMGPGRRGRAQRGDVRAAVLVLLSEEPMHGYQIMQAIQDRTNGRWTPSPGAIYPTISQLEDEGLVTVTVEAGAGRKLVALTEAGRGQVAADRENGIDPFSDFAGEDAGPDLRGLLHQLHGAAREVARTGSAEQMARAAEILSEARRALYLLLAGDG